MAWAENWFDWRRPQWLDAIRRGSELRRGPRRCSARRARIGRRAAFEPLEDRHLLATLMVNSALDNTTSGNGLVTLREAILAANTDGMTDLGETGSGVDTIVFDPVVFATPQSILMSLGEFQISQALSIEGTGHDKLTISGQSASRIFNIDATPGLVSFTGLKLTNGKAAGDGGAIRVTSHDVDVSVSGCIITGNTASGSGGAIHAAGSVFVSDSSVTGNSVVIGTIPGIRGLDVNVTDSTVSGGIVGTAAVQVTRTTVTGGGVQGEPVSLTDSEVTGLVFSKYGDTNIGGSTLHSGLQINTAPIDRTATITDSSVAGGVVFGDDDVIVNNSTITGGTKDGIRGYYGSVTLNSSTISGSKSGVSLFGGSVTLNNSHIIDNTGNGIHQTEGHSVTLNSSTIMRNKAGGISMNPFEYSMAEVVLNSSQVSDNGQSSGFSVGGMWAKTVTITDSIVHGNKGHATGSFHYVGGGITAFTATLTNSTVSGNSANLGGGGLRVGTANVTNSTISGNSTGGDGGAILANTITVLNSTISGNTASGQGGGIRSYSAAAVSNKYSTVTDNQAASGGGVWKENGALTISGSIVAENTGGSNPDLRKVGGTLTVTNSLIGNNAGTTLAEAQTPDSNGNLIGSAAGGGVIDPLLGSLADNGGPTKTHALLAGSPAIDAVVPPADPFGFAAHIYQLNGSLTDAQGGPALVGLGGIQTATGYQFGPNEGLTLSSPDIAAGEYSIEIVFS